MERLLRSALLRLATGERDIRFRRYSPSPEALRERFAGTGPLGVYLHIPFCERICPYCPYNKELFREDLARRYAEAAAKEIGIYAGILRGVEIASFYVGGGTPTTMLRCGLPDLIDAVRTTLGARCGVHMESHPNHLTEENLRTIKAMDVKHLSIGIESLNDEQLRALGRTYNAASARDAVQRAVSAGFVCLNVDIMFGLPGQTCDELAQTARALIDLGVDQVAAYPIFLFPYTRMGRENGSANHGLARSLARRRMLRVLERIFYAAGYERSSVWAFTRRGVPRYCSVTVPAYVGFGASGGTYLRDVFYVNTFGVSEYVEAIDEGRLPIALAVDLTDKMQRAGWLYWRIYETRFSKRAYRDRFGEDIDTAYGGLLRLLRLLGLLRIDQDRISLTDRGAFWLHAGEDILSIDYISRLWGEARRNHWPEAVQL